MAVDQVNAQVKTAPLHPRVLPYANSPVIAIDTETTGLDWWDRRFRLGGVVLYAPEAGADYIPVGHETMFDTNEDRAHVADSVAQLASDPSRLWLMHNRPYDENVLAREGVKFQNVLDTMSLWWCIDSHHRGFALKKLGAEYVDKDAAQEERKLDNFLRTNKLSRYTQVPVEVLAPYARQDGILTYRLWQEGRKRLKASQVEVHETEQRWVGLVSSMCRRGIPVDRELAQSIIDSHLAEAHQLRISLAGMCGMRGFNPNSGPQVQAAAARLGVPLSDTQATTILASNLPRDVRFGIVRFRQLYHTVTSYLEPLINISRNAIDGRAHTSLRTTTKTGRIAAADPINLTGLPKQGSGEDVHRVRECIRFEDGVGRRMGYNDYAQIDVRVGAHYSQDPGLLEILKDPEGDIHSYVKGEVNAMGIEIERSMAKRLVFGAQYDIGKDKFAEDVSGLNSDGEWIQVRPSEADVWLKAYRRRFPGARMMSGRAENTMKSRGYIVLWDGREMGCPEWEDPHKTFAWLIQAGGAQLIKRASLRADEWLKREGLDASFNLMVHDELIFEASESDAVKVATGVAYFMATAWPGARVPLYVTPTLGEPSWAEEKAVGPRIPESREVWERWLASGPPSVEELTKGLAA